MFSIARLTGLAYLGLALSGMAYYLGTRTRIYAAGSATETLGNITADPALAHLDVGLQLLVVLFQALAAAGFYALLRPTNPVAAWMVGVFGMTNAILILVAAGAAAAGVAMAMDPSVMAGADIAAVVQAVYVLGEQMWAVGALFFGLWLLPMGWFAATSGRMPRPLGWLLIAGGVGYCASAFVSLGVDGAPQWLVDALSTLATPGEFWILLYLLTIGLRPLRDASADQPEVA